MIKRILFLSFIFIQFIVRAASGDSSRVDFKIQKPDEQHPIVYQAVLQLLSSYHYNKLKIDDDFSSKVLDNYIKHLDPSRVYFTDGDIKSLEKFRYKFDDAIYSNDIQPIYDIYNLFQQRMKERINYTIDIIQHDFDFSIVDSFMFDREKAPWCTDTTAENKLWYRKIKYECLIFKATGKDYKSYSETIRKRYTNLEKQISKTKSEDVFGMFMNSLTELADPHTNYFSPRVAEDFNNSMSLSLEGIGAQLQTDGVNTKVIQIIKGGPADSSKKLFANDKIIGVGQGNDSEIVSVVDWRIDDVVSLIRGKKGTVVRLEIIPASDPTKTKVIKLIRDKIKLEEQACKSSVKEVNVNNKKLKIGVVYIPTFYIDFAAAQRGDKNYTSTTRDVKRLIDDLKKQNVNGIVIDLRNNGGGSLQEAVELTGLFIKTGPVVQVKDVYGKVKSEMDNDEKVYYDGPLAVLVNRMSASASEIFSGAIQDYNRGIIIGERTYGKGTVQNVIDLNNMIQFNHKTLGQVKITLAKFYRITGNSTQHKGVTPDILFPGLYDDSKFGEDASEFALPWDQIEPAKQIKIVDTKQDAENPKIIQQNKDFILIGKQDKQISVLLDKHNKRIATNPEYKYLLEDIALMKKNDAENYITINEKAYKAKTDEGNNLKKQREEARKKLYGTKDIKQVKDSSDKKAAVDILDEDGEIIKPIDAAKENPDGRDLILNEAEFVIGDILNSKKD